MENGELVILDTDFLIEMLSLNETALNVTENSGLYISIVSKAELMRGALNKVHLTGLIKDIGNFTIIDLDTDVSNVFDKLMLRYSLSHKIGIADALIAATAVTYELPLLTCNAKHFGYISGLKLPQHNVKPLRKRIR